MVCNTVRVDARTYHRIVIFWMICLLVVGSLGGGWVGTAAATHGTADRYEPPADVVRDTPIVSARDHFRPAGWVYFLTDSVRFSDGHFDTDYQTTGDVPGMEVGECPPELVIYVHGYRNTERGAINNFNNAEQSLTALGYGHPVVGFSWDSHEGALPLPWWDVAEEIADLTGPKLAAFLSDYHRECPSTRSRVIAHSLGSRVVLSALGSLDTWNGPVVTSVHFLGSAVDPSLVTIAPGREGEETYGLAIVNNVGQLHNKFNRRDWILHRTYPVGRGFSGGALGRLGARPDTELPVNYHEQDVTDTMREVFFGGDHSAYLLTAAEGGVMDEVVRDWTNEGVVALLQDGSPPTPLGSELQLASARYNDRIPRGLKVYLWDHDDVVVDAAIDSIASDAYLVRFDGQGNAEIVRYDRAIVGHEPMLREPRGRWMYKPTRSTTRVWGRSDTLLAIMTSCDGITAYEDSIEAGSVEHRLGSARTKIAYRAVTALKAQFQRAYDQLGDDDGRTCGPSP